MRVESINSYTKERCNRVFISPVKQNTGDKFPVEKSNISNYYYRPFFTSSELIIQNDDLRDLILNQNSSQTDILWNREYIPHLDKQFIEYGDDGTLAELITAANKGDFKKYLHGNNLYAVSNDVTADLFRNVYGFNYDKWLNPPKHCEVNFISEDINKKRLKQCADSIAYEFNERLLKSPAKNYIIKKLDDNIQNGELVIPRTIHQSKKKLYNYNEGLIKQLDKVWSRAEKNKDSNLNNLKSWANEILTSHDDLLQIQDEIKNIKTTKGKNEYNLTIKMWDRNPYKDIFQGNYSTCCIGMGRRNGDMMPLYLLHSCFNMIELVDNNSGKTIGNALCYFAESDNEPVFIIDNVEMNSSYKPSDDVGEKIRDAVVLYSKNLIKEVCPDQNIKIYMGNDRNDIPVPKNPPAESKIIKFIGDIRSDIYLDVYGGHVFNTEELTKEVPLCRLY